MPQDDDDGESTGDREMQILRSHALQLHEHFESVQIIVTRHDVEEDGTVLAHHGEGNWFARYGSVKEWLLKLETRTKREVMREGDDE